jgi:hypothetical protein
MKMDKDTLIKQRFWVTLCVSLPLLLIGVIWLSFVIPASIATERKKADESLKAAQSAAKNPKTVLDVEEVKKVADKFKAKEDYVWITAYEAQKDLFTWPRAFENEFHFQDGNFVTEVKVKGKDEQEPAEPEPGKFHGKTSQVDTYFIRVQGKKGSMTFRATPDAKINTGDEAKQSWADIKKGMDVVVTYIQGRYFGDKLTQKELVTFAQTYKSQLADLFNILDPIRSDGKGVLQFGDNFVQTDKRPYPEALPTQRYFRYVTKWDEETIKTEWPWLAQEDLWVQREIYRLIRQANDYVAAFTPELTATQVHVLRTAKPDIKTPEDDTHVLGRVVGMQTTPGSEMLVVLGKNNRRYHVHLPADKKVEVKIHLEKKKEDKDQAEDKDRAPGAADEKAKADEKGQAEEKTKADEKAKAEEAAKPGETGKDEKKAPKVVELRGVRDKDEVYVAHTGLGKVAVDKDQEVVFTNPNWTLSLKVVKEGSAVRVSLTNRLPRRQRLDFNLLVRFQRDEKQGTEIEVPGDSLPPAGSRDDKNQPLDTVVMERELPAGTNPTGIYDARQELTWETAAIRRLDQVNFGEAVSHSHRTMPKQVVMLPAFKPPEEEKKEGADTQSAGEKGGMPSGVKMRGPGAPGGPGGFGPALGAPGGAGKASEGPDLVFERYADVAKQARRIPVCVVVLVDQDHVQRVLASFADSKLRFWTTQVILNRFPGSLRPSLEVEAEGGDAASPPGPGKFVPGTPPGGPGGVYGERRRPPTGFGSFPGGPGGLGGPGFGKMGKMRGFSGPGGMPGSPPPGMPGIGIPGGFGGPPGGDATVAAGDDNDRNVELVIYGIVSLYERYPPKPASDTATTTAK